jgi:hypothetical protein
MSCEDCPYTLPCYQDRFKHNLGLELLVALCPRCGVLSVSPHLMNECDGPALFFCSERVLTKAIRRKFDDSIAGLGPKDVARWTIINDPGPGSKLYVYICPECYAKNPMKGYITALFSHGESIKGYITALFSHGESIKGDS